MLSGRDESEHITECERHLVHGTYTQNLLVLTQEIPQSTLAPLLSVWFWQKQRRGHVSSLQEPLDYKYT